MEENHQEIWQGIQGIQVNVILHVGTVRGKGISRDLSLEEFYTSAFNPPPGPLVTCATVVERLGKAVMEIASR